MKKKLEAIAAVLVLVTLLAGCLGQTPPPPETIFIFGSSGDAVRLDPADVTDGESIQRMDNIHEGLVEYDGGTTNIRPCLATDWTISDDKKTLTFNLRKGVKFHHGFGEMTADDVVFSFARQYDPNNWYYEKGEWAYWGYMFTDIESVEKLDTYKIAIHMKLPNASIMTSLAMFTVCIVSEKAAQQYGDDYFKNPVGTGPFEFVEWVKDDHITLQAFQDYWRDPPQLGQLVFKVIPDPSARLMALQAGEVHGIEHVDPKQLDIIKSDPELQLISQAGMNVGYVALNCGEGYVDANKNGKWDAGEEVEVPGAFEPFKDVRVRQAIAYAIDKDSIVRNLYQGAATVAVEGMPPVLFGYNNSITGYPYNPQKARDLLAAAGYPDGFTVSLWNMPVSRPYFPVPTEIAEAIQADLAAVGITAELFTEDWGTYLQDTEAGKHSMAMLGWTGDNGDPDNFLNVLYSQDKATVGSAGNIGFKKNPEFQDLLNRALLTFDQDERAALYEQANALLVDQCSHVFIAHADQNLAFLSTVHGYVIHPTSRKFFYPVWVEEEAGGEGLGTLFVALLLMGGIVLRIRRK
ncbi:MAG: ABC transporter substrate-binding protein [Candidatus Methanofastidiosia archaeon]